MDNTTFTNLVNEIRAASMDTLTAKNAKYATDGDRLHNFVAGGGVMGGTAAQACWGYLTKHLVALRDKVERNDFSDREDLKEKCQDAINYIVFLWCIGNEERALRTRTEVSVQPFKGDYGLGLTAEERAKYAAPTSVSVPLSYREMAEKVSDGPVSFGVECPSVFFLGAPNMDSTMCPQDCTKCWDMPYKGERAHDNIGGD